MRVALFANVCLPPLMACTTETPAALSGTFALGADSTRAFTERHYRTQRSIDEPAARAMGTELAAELHGVVQLEKDGTGTVHLEDSSGAVTRDVGPMTQTGRQIILTGREPGSGGVELDWIHGSGALRLESPIGEGDAILVFQAAPGPDDWLTQPPPRLGSRYSGEPIERQYDTARAVRGRRTMHHGLMSNPRPRGSLEHRERTRLRTLQAIPGLHQA